MAKKVKDMNCQDDESGSTLSLEARIAELAYFKAERRGFAPGHEQDDWLEAEQECLLSESNNPQVISDR
jgi:hypothetical protein